MSHIIAIGGGLIRTRETFLIDKYIVCLSKKEKPNVVFIPTASDDDDGYQAIFEEVYGGNLKCNVKHILFTKKKYTLIDLEKILNWADIIYVGGGNTKKMLEVWKQNNFFDLIKKYHKQESKILAGLSAGAICWFKYGNSDSPLFENPNSEIKTEKLNALGLINAALCPHYNTEKFRTSEFDKMMKETTDCVGIAIDNNCAIHFYKNTYKIIRSVQNANAYRITSFNKEKINDKGITNELLYF